MTKQLNRNTFIGLVVLMLIALNIYFNMEQSQENKALQNDIASLNKQLTVLGDKATSIQAELDLLKRRVEPGIHKLAMK